MSITIEKAGEIRVPCQVPHCGKSYERSRGHSEWICADHWKLVPRSYRSVLRRTGKACVANLTSRNLRRNERAWKRCVRMAIEAAAGIA